MKDKEQILNSIIDQFNYDSENGIVYFNNKPFGTLNNCGYLRSGFKLNNKYLGFYTHRLAWRLYYGEWPKGEINHKNGIKYDNRIDNLEDITHKENMQHGYTTGLLNNTGENHGKVKLTEIEILEIREKYLTGKYTMRLLAKEYNVSFQQIHRIVNNKQWKHMLYSY